MADTATPTTAPHSPWNMGRFTGQKPPLKLREDRSVRTRLQMAGNTREIALFNLAVDSKLRGCDLVRLLVRDLAHGSQVLARANVVHVAREDALANLQRHRPPEREPAPVVHDIADGQFFTDLLHKIVE